MKDTLLNGDHENYSMDYGYTLHMINDSCSEGITGETYVQKYMCEYLYLHVLYLNTLEWCL